MIKIGYFFVAVAVCSLFYNFGYTAAQLQYVEKENVLLDATTRSYNARLEELNQVNQQLNEQIKTYADSNRALSDRAAALRVQLDRARFTAKAPACPMDKSKSTPEFSSGWSGKMDTVLKRATDLIIERDRIALAYNELREQCQLK